MRCEKDATPEFMLFLHGLCHMGTGLFLVAMQVLSLACAAPQQADDPSPHSTAELIPEVRSVQPGKPFSVGLRIELDPGWHTYWINPGDAGQPAAIDWDMPAGYGAGEIQWPFPRKVEESTVVSYGYENEVLLLTEITPPGSLTPGQTVTLAAEAHWLVCSNICLPAMAELDFEIRISDEAAAPNARRQEAFAETRASLPVVAESWTMSASRTEGGFDLQIVPAHSPPPSFDGAFFFASERGVLAHGGQQRITRADGVVHILLLRSKHARNEPARLKGVLVMPDPVELGVDRARAVAVNVAVTGESNNK
jgi:thiol:disulfide interchange protein DsbD